MSPPAPLARSPVSIGQYPTPVEHLTAWSRPGCDLWVKRDDRTAPLYGGNKVRKLEFLLDEARRRGAKRIVTVGAAGSHHVLATTLYGRQAGLRVAAVLTRQPRTAHAVEVLSASLAQGLEAYPAPTVAGVALRLAQVVGRGDFVVPPGGTNVAGGLGYFAAARELCDQVHRGEMPMPDLVFVAVGSGGTAAGLVAGLRSAGAATTVVGVRVVEPWMAGPRRVVWLARAIERAAEPQGPVERRQSSASLVFERGFLGRGYGYPTGEGVAASREAESLGITLEPTYTAKTFAATLRAVRSGAARTILYWHTFSSAPLGPLVRDSDGAVRPLPAALEALLVPLGPNT